MNGWLPNVYTTLNAHTWNNMRKYDKDTTIDWNSASVSAQPLYLEWQYKIPLKKQNVNQKLLKRTIILKKTPISEYKVGNQS